MHHWTKLFCTTAIGAFSINALAATATSNFQVQATVSASCNIAANPLTFVTPYDPTVGTEVDGQTTLDITCTAATAYTVALNAGNGIGATVATRKMTSGANTLDYALYREAARTSIWGTTEPTETVAGTGTGAAQTLTVYGKILSGQTTVPAGTYTDTVTATITF
ncbi:MAG: spore coat U domain-containing protein [Candidatus Berkiella sp.]